MLFQKLRQRKHELSEVKNDYGHSYKVEGPDNRIPCSLQKFKLSRLR